MLRNKIKLTLKYALNLRLETQVFSSQFPTRPDISFFRFPNLWPEKCQFLVYFNKPFIFMFQVLAAHGCGRLFQHKWIVLHQLCLSAQTLWKLWQTIKTWALQHLKKNLWKCVRKFFWNFFGETKNPTKKNRKPKILGSFRVLLISELVY